MTKEESSEAISKSKGMLHKEPWTDIIPNRHQVSSHQYAVMIFADTQTSLKPN